MASRAVSADVGWPRMALRGCSSTSGASDTLVARGEFSRFRSGRPALGRFCIAASSLGVGLIADGIETGTEILIFM